MRKRFPICRIAVIACVGLTLSCGRQTELPATDTTKSEAQKLPFDHPPQSAGISPSRSLIPSLTRLPEGTPLTICLQRELSSASATQGDSFAATLDAPIVIDGQTLVPRGAAASGRVLDARHSTGPRDPGYLRLALVTLTVSQRTFPIETSSLFAKGGSREERNSATSGAGADHGKGAMAGPTTSAAAGPAAAAQKEVVLGPERRLSFRLAQNLDLQ